MADIDIARTGANAAAGLPGTSAISRVRWGAVLAGLAVTLALQFVLYLVGLALGLGAYDVGDRAKPFGIGAAVWLLLVPLVALFIGGMTTGRLAGVIERKDGFLHGVLTWSLATLVGVWLLSNGIGAVAGNTFRLAGNVVGATATVAGQGIAAATSAAASQVSGGDLDLASLRREVDEALRQTGDPSLRTDSLQADARQAQQVARGGASNEQLTTELGDLIRDRADNLDRQDLVNVIAARTELSQAEAERLADRVQSFASRARSQVGEQVAEVRTSAGEVVDEGASNVAGGIWLALLALGLSLAAAVFGTLRTARE